MNPYIESFKLFSLAQYQIPNFQPPTTTHLNQFNDDAEL